MTLIRQCSRSGCRQTAVATITFGYAEQAVVVGPLATYAEPHTYDMCRDHAERLSPPRGWQLTRLAVEFEDPTPDADDLLALADAVREAGRARPATRPRAAAAGEQVPSGVREVARRGHLRVLRDI